MDAPLNRVFLTAIAFMSYMIMAGLLTQIGVILNAVSSVLGSTPSQSVGVFSWLTGGALCGTFISLFLYAKFSLKPILLTNYSVFLCALLALSISQPNQFFSLAILLFVLGVCCGCGLSGGAVVISKTYHEAKRASAFIATDCAFSAAGYIFPSLAAVIIASHYEWTLSYAAVGALALALWGLVFFATFPKTEADETGELSALQQFTGILTPRVCLIALGVCIYLISQTTFLTWSPNYLQAAFGLSETKAASVVGNYWGMSIFGLISAAIFVNKVPQRRFLMIVAVLASVFTLGFVLIEQGTQFLLLSYFFGFATTCIYKLAMSVGSQQLPRAPAVLITFLLFSGSIGSTLAPALSGWVVGQFGVHSAMTMAWLGYSLVALLFGACLWLEKRHQGVRHIMKEGI